MSLCLEVFNASANGGRLLPASTSTSVAAVVRQGTLCALPLASCAGAGGQAGGSAGIPRFTSSWKESHTSSALFLPPTAKLGLPLPTLSDTLLHSHARREENQVVGRASSHVSVKSVTRQIRGTCSSTSTVIAFTLQVNPRGI